MEGEIGGGRVDSGASIEEGGNGVDAARDVGSRVRAERRAS